MLTDYDRYDFEENANGSIKIIRKMSAPSHSCGGPGGYAEARDWEECFNRIYPTEKNIHCIVEEREIQITITVPSEKDIPLAQSSINDIVKKVNIEYQKVCEETREQEKLQAQIDLQKVRRKEELQQKYGNNKE